MSSWDDGPVDGFQVSSRVVRWWGAIVPSWAGIERTDGIILAGHPAELLERIRQILLRFNALEPIFRALLPLLAQSNEFDPRLIFLLNGFDIPIGELLNHVLVGHFG
jgi:hypothetical protein